MYLIRLFFYSLDQHLVYLLKHQDCRDSFKTFIETLIEESVKRYHVSPVYDRVPLTGVWQAYQFVAYTNHDMMPGQSRLEDPVIQELFELASELVTFLDSIRVYFVTSPNPSFSGFPSFKQFMQLLNMYLPRHDKYRLQGVIALCANLKWLVCTIPSNDTGTHEELMDSNKTYKQIVRLVEFISKPVEFVHVVGYLEEFCSMRDAEIVCLTPVEQLQELLVYPGTRMLSSRFMQDATKLNQYNLTLEAAVQIQTDPTYRLPPVNIDDSHFQELVFSILAGTVNVAMTTLSNEELLKNLKYVILEFIDVFKCVTPTFDLKALVNHIGPNSSVADMHKLHNAFVKFFNMFQVQDQAMIDKIRSCKKPRADEKVIFLTLILCHMHQELLLYTTRIANRVVAKGGVVIMGVVRKCIEYETNLLFPELPLTKAAVYESVALFDGLVNTVRTAPDIKSKLDALSILTRSVHRVMFGDALFADQVPEIFVPYVPCLQKVFNGSVEYIVHAASASQILADTFHELQITEESCDELIARVQGNPALDKRYSIDCIKFGNDDLDRLASMTLKTKFHNDNVIVQGIKAQIEEALKSDIKNTSSLSATFQHFTSDLYQFYKDAVESLKDVRDRNYEVFFKVLSEIISKHIGVDGADAAGGAAMHD